MTGRPAWQDQIVQDLAPFCDLGTAPAPTFSAAVVDLTLTRAGKTYQLEITQDLGQYFVSLDGKTKSTLREVLAGPVFGDLQRLAQQVVILAGLRKNAARKEVKGRTIYPEDWYVDPRLFVERPDWSDEAGLADELLARMVAETTGTATDLIFLTAQAGQGKSSCLRRFHLSQAQRYRTHEADRLTFYVDAQGRGLANLADVLSREINELQLNLPYAAILSLVRHNLITLIVDGFDELVGARGTYQGAFSSLTTFLELLGGTGQMIAAARSAFFTQEYLDRPGVLLDTAGSRRVTRIQLANWGQEEREAFLDRARSASQGFVTKGVAESFRGLESARHGELLARPLFSRDVLLSLMDRRTKLDTTTDLDLVATIAENYVLRETEDKLLSRARLPILTPLQLTQFFEDLSSEMWSLETREVDLPTAKTLMELDCEEWGIDPANARIVVERVGALPFLQADIAQQRTMSFEHELFFSYFFTRDLAENVLGNSAGAQLALSKARLSEDDASLLAERCRRIDNEAQDLIDRLSKIATKRHPRQAQVQVNCGSVVAGVLRSASRGLPAQGLKLSGFVFDGDSLRGSRLVDVEFTNCTFNRVDLRDAEIQGLARNTEIFDALLDGQTTRVALIGLDPELPVVQVERIVAGHIEPVYGSEARSQLLRETGFLGEVPQQPRFAISEARLNVISGLCHAFDEMNPVGDRHSRYQSVFGSPEWPHIRAALTEFELVSEERKSTAGPRQVFFRKRFKTADLLAALLAPSGDEAIEGFWKAQV